MPKTRVPVAALERSPSHLLHRALQLALDIYTVETGAGALTQRQFAVLAAVAAKEGLTQTDLVRTTGIDRSTLADMVGRMIAKGWLARERSTADARANAVTLSEDGRAMLEAAGPKVAAADQRILAILGAKKREPFVDALRKLARAGEVSLLPESSDPVSGAVEDRPAKAKKSKGGKKRRKAAAKLAGAQADLQAKADTAPPPASESPLIP